MNILTKYLKDFISVPQNIDELTNKHIIEVEEYSKVANITNIVTGHVLTCERHPNSDHLHVCTVDVKNEILQIVCGAPNVKKGQYVIVALVGAILPGDFKIKKSVIRGVESSGMICSLKELGINEKLIEDAHKDGIYSFDKQQELGVDALKTLGLDGYKMTLGITPNRGDLLSHLGFAYDLQAVSGKKVKLSIPTIKENSGNNNDVSVLIESSGCGRYYARSMSVKIKPSPIWLKNALMEFDIRPINNVVDITNYCLMLYGTPLHAFDKNKVKTNKIVVKSVDKKTKVIALDEQEYEIIKGDCIITDGTEPIAIGGIMGLKNSMIDDNTKQIILEAAYFDPKHIQQTSRRLSLKSDSSLRFERRVDDKRVIIGLEKATELLIKYADAKVDAGISECISFTSTNQTIQVTLNKINKELNTTLTNEEVKDIFDRLNYVVLENKSNEYLVTAPTYRDDIRIPEDVYEEIARIYGYDKISGQNINISTQGGLTYYQKMVRKIRNTLSTLGLNEIMTYSLIKDSFVNKFDESNKHRVLLKPLNEERKTLRTNLVAGLMEASSYNTSRSIDDIALFEIGHVFNENTEENHLVCALQGKFIDTLYHKKDINADFYVLKSILENILELFEISYDLKPYPYSFLHPYISANIMVNKENIGYIGKLHPKVAKSNGLDEYYLFEINLDKIINQPNEVVFNPISKYPSIKRDISLIVSNDVKISDIQDIIKQTARKLITNIELFDLYQGDNLPDNTKSLAFSITFNTPDRTLEKEDVEKALKSIKLRLQMNFNAILRD